MKIVISDQPPHFLDLNAPTLPAEPVTCPETGQVHWRIWCRYCERHHFHGPGEGHRLAHCDLPPSPYHRAGYNFAYKAH